MTNVSWSPRQRSLTADCSDYVHLVHIFIALSSVWFNQRKLIMWLLTRTNRIFVWRKVFKINIFCQSNLRKLFLSTTIWFLLLLLRVKYLIVSHLSYISEKSSNFFFVIDSSETFLNKKSHSGWRCQLDGGEKITFLTHFKMP